MNKSIIKKASCIALASLMFLSGQALATDGRSEAQGKLQESTINSMIVDKKLGYSANYDLRIYKYIRIEDIGTTNANWAITAAKLLEYSNKSSMEISAKHIDYATAYNSTKEGNENSYNRNLGQAANMKVALGYITSGRGPVAKNDYEWDGKLDKTNNSTLKSKKVTYTLENYRIFPSIYKMTFDTGEGTKFTYAYNDPIIYTSTEDQIGGDFSASKDITTYTGGEIEQNREEIKEHIIKYGAVSATIYRNDLDYFIYKEIGEEVYHHEHDSDGDCIKWTDRQDTNKELCYYCSTKKLTPNHDVVIIGWDDEFQVPGAPGKGAYLVLDPTKVHAEYFLSFVQTSKWYSDIYMNGKYWFPSDKRIVDTNYYYVSYYDYYIESNIYGLKETSFTNYSKTYQHDELGMSTSINATDASTIAFGANVFNRNSTTPETLNAISIASETKMKYEIYVNPKSGELSEDNLIKVATTDVLDAGYNTIHLDKLVVLTGEKFAVAVKYITDTSNEAATMARIGVESPRQKIYHMISANQSETKYEDIAFWSGKATSAQGQSFIGTNLNNWTDLYSNAETKDVNICIKAYVTTNPDYKIPSEKIELKQEIKDSFGEVTEQEITDTIKVIKGDSVSLSAKIIPTDAEDKTITWISSNKSVATVDKNGQVTTHSGGTVTITARVTNTPTIYAECTIDVRVPVESFVLNKTNVTVLGNETNVLAAIIGPDDATNKKVEWSSNNKDVVRVTEDGLLIGLKQGTAIVTAVLRDENGVHTATCKVTVPVSLIVDVTGISLNKTSLQLTKGTRETLVATILPADATNTSMVWTSSDKSVALVNSNGRVTALSAGTATITVTSVNGGYTASCKVTVIEEEVVKVTGVSLDKISMTLERDQTAKLVATVKPSNSKNKKVSWSSSNLDVVEVDENGKLTAIAPGTAIITVTTDEGGYMSTCAITVSKAKVKVTGISLDRTFITLDKGNSTQLMAGVLPVNANNNKINWTSSNSNIVTVDENGKLTAVGFGDVVITATTEEGGYSKKCMVTVPEVIAVTGIELSSNELTIEKGITSKLEVKILPENATNKNFSYEIGDSKIATVAGEGVKAIEIGQTTITYKTEDGSYIATCTINVIETTKQITISSNNYQISEDNKIYNVSKNTTVAEAKESIKTDGTIKEVLDKNGKPIADDGKIGTGSTITITKDITTTPEGGGETTTTTITETYVIRVDGDLNGDGTVSITDFSILKQCVLQQITLEGIVYEAGDLNADGKITLTDLSMLKQQILADEEVE